MFACRRATGVPRQRYGRNISPEPHEGVEGSHGNGCMSNRHRVDENFKKPSSNAHIACVRMVSSPQQLKSLRFLPFISFRFLLRWIIE